MQTRWLMMGLLLCPLVAHGAVRYAGPSGSGNAGCGNSSSGNPISGLNNGMNCLNGGDTLIVKNGTYAELVNGGNIPNGSAGAPTIIQAENLHGAVIQPTGSPIVFVEFENTGSTWIIIDGVVIDGSQVHRPTIALRIGNVSNLVFQNLEIRNQEGATTAANTQAVSAGGSSTANIRLTNLYVHDIGVEQIGLTSCADGSQACFSYGVYMTGTGFTIENSRFQTLSGYGIHGYPGPVNNIIRNNTFDTVGASGAILCGTNNQFYNNIITNTGHSRTAPALELVRFCGSGGSHFIANNTIYNSGSPGNPCIHMGAADNSVVRNNLCWSNVNDTITNGGGVNTVDTNLCNPSGSTGGAISCPFYTDPVFVNAGGGDFHLQSSSPTQVKTGGVDLGSIFTTDYDGNDRIAPWSLGAFEEGAGGPSLPAPSNLRLISITNP